MAFKYCVDCRTVNPINNAECFHCGGKELAYFLNPEEIKPIKEANDRL